MFSRGCTRCLLETVDLKKYALGAVGRCPEPKLISEVHVPGTV